MTAELKNILFVEDDEDIADIAVIVLEQLGGFEVTHCASGQLALDAYPNTAPQLVLMDVMMPCMDGPRTLAHLQQTYGESCAPIIFMTARAQSHEQQAYRDLGALGVIVKPFDPMTLCGEIKSIWSTHHAA